MQKQMITLLVVFLLISCQKTEKPYTLSDEKLVNILADVHISEAAVGHLSLALRDSVTKIYLDQILVIHKVEKEVFKSEYDRLKTDPDKLEVIYQKIIDRLNELKLKKSKEDIKKENKK